MNKEYTLQDCINGFNAHRGTHMEAIFIKRMESLSEWRVASKYWSILGRNSDADACSMIADATQRGDDYREATKHLSDWIDKTVEEGIMEKDEAIKFIYPQLNEIYRQHFVTTST